MFLLKKIKQYSSVNSKKWKSSFISLSSLCPGFLLRFWCAWFGGGKGWSGVRGTGIESQLCHMLAMDLWAQASVCSSAKWRDHSKSLGEC